MVIIDAEDVSDVDEVEGVKVMDADVEETTRAGSEDGTFVAIVTAVSSEVKPGRGAELAAAGIGEVLGAPHWLYGG
jgi:hypothetical protein